MLDYVTAWYLKAAKYIQGTKIRVAYVSTNSITQGEQVATLWRPLLNNYGIIIHFAHRTFKWTIEAKKAKGMKVAAVHSVIIGFANYETEKKYLFLYETITADPFKAQVRNINPYLVEAENIFIDKRRSPLCDCPVMLYGSKPVDGGFFVLSDGERENLIKKRARSKSMD